MPSGLYDLLRLGDSIVGDINNLISNINAGQLSFTKEIMYNGTAVKVKAVLQEGNQKLGTVYPTRRER